MSICQYFVVYIYYKIIHFFTITLQGASMMKPLKSKVSITLDSDVIEKIKLLAEEDDRSFSQYINLILKEHLNQKEA